MSVTRHVVEWQIIACIVVAMFVSGCVDSHSRTALSEDGIHVFDIQTPEELRDLLSYSEGHVPIVNSHRGGAREGFPENSIETFENTLAHTWSMMEVDPRYTKDSTIVLFHDDTLGRTSTGTGRVMDYTYDELKEFRLEDINGTATEFAIPTLSEALEWARGKSILFLDSKDVSVEERVRMIEKHDAKAYTVVMAYNLEEVQHVYDIDPEIMMQVFIPDYDAINRFNETEIPWRNIVAFVSHSQSIDYNILESINNKGVLTVIGTSRTIDREYINGEMSREELYEGYRNLVRKGVNIIEADLGVEAGRAIYSMQDHAPSKKKYYKYIDGSR